MQWCPPPSSLRLFHLPKNHHKVLRLARLKLVLSLARIALVAISRSCTHPHNRSKVTLTWKITSQHPTNRPAHWWALPTIIQNNGLRNQISTVSHTRLTILIASHRLQFVNNRTTHLPPVWGTPLMLMWFLKTWLTSGLCKDNSCRVMNSFKLFFTFVIFFLLPFNTKVSAVFRTLSKLFFLVFHNFNSVSRKKSGFWNLHFEYIFTFNIVKKT